MKRVMKELHNAWNYWMLPCFAVFTFLIFSTRLYMVGGALDGPVILVTGLPLVANKMPTSVVD